MSSPQTILGKEDRFLRGNTHTHTNNSDGQLTPEAVARWYADEGYDFLVLTDHNTPPWRHAPTVLAEPAPLTTLTGAELHPAGTRHGDRWHIIAVGMPPGFDPRPYDRDAPGLVRTLNSMGAWVCVAHPQAQGLSAEDIVSLGTVHAVEIYNERSIWWDEKPDGWYLADDLASKGTMLGGVAVDDAHFDGPPDHGRAWIMVDAPNSPEQILSALHAHAYFSTQGPALHGIVRVGNELEVQCSPVATITLAGLGQKAHTHVGEALEQASFDLTPHTDSYVRVTIRDVAGKRAWSNLIHV